LCKNLCEVGAMTETSLLLQRIHSTYSQLSDGKQRVAQFILDDWQEVAFCTATELGRRVGVSPSVVVRFASDLGYDGYADLQKVLKSRVRRYLTTTERHDISSQQAGGGRQMFETVAAQDIDNIKLTLRENDIATLNRAVKLLLGSEQIMIAARRASRGPAILLDEYLNIVFGNATLLPPDAGDSPNLLKKAGPKTLLIAISLPRYSASTLRCVSFLKEQGARVVAITDSLVAPIARQADVVLIVKADGLSFARSHVATVSVINQLFAMIGIRDSASVRQNLEEYEELVERYASHTYVEE